MPRIGFCWTVEVAGAAADPLAGVPGIFAGEAEEHPVVALSTKQPKAIATRTG
jgi:hypothetical protein